MKDSQGPRPSSRGTFLGPGDAERVRFPTQRYVRLGWCLRKAFGPKKYHTHLLRPLLQTAVRAPACFISTTATILLLQTHRYPTYLLSNFTHTSHLWPYASCRHTSDIGPHWGSPRLSTSLLVAEYKCKCWFKKKRKKSTGHVHIPNGNGKVPNY